MLNYPFANSYNLESTFAYNTSLTAPRWRELSYAATVEWAVSQTVELVAQTSVSYTQQTESYNTVEIRPALGTRLYLTPSRRIQTRLLLRVEQRNFKNLQTQEWDHVFRPRARAEVIVPITQDSYFKDNLWYALGDVEWLFATTDVEERFANRFRMRLALGYRLNYSLRFELMYMLQQSRNGIDDTFTSTDTMYRIRLKHYLRKSKPSKATGTGN